MRHVDKCPECAAYLWKIERTCIFHFTFTRQVVCACAREFECWQHVKHPRHILGKRAHKSLSNTAFGAGLSDRSRSVRHECFAGPCGEEVHSNCGWTVHSILSAAHLDMKWYLASPARTKRTYCDLGEFNNAGESFWEALSSLFTTFLLDRTHHRIRYAR